jgi:hypothetical protein
MVNTPERARPAAEATSLSTIGAFGLLAITAHLSGPALITRCRGILIIAGPLSFETLPTMAPRRAVVGDGLVFVAGGDGGGGGVVVIVAFGSVRRRTGTATSLGKSHLFSLYDKAKS